MSFLTVAYALLFYVATAVFVVFTVRRIMLYAKTPAPLKIPTTPAPTTKGGVAFRMFREVVFFESLFKSTKWTWVFGYLFHFGLFLVLARHLRYFTNPVPAPVEWIQFIGMYASIAMVAGLFGLLGRRLFVDRVRYITAPSDFLHLILLILIGLSGMAMTFVEHTDIVRLKGFFMGLMTFNWSSMDLPADPLLIVHLTLVATLMIIFPFSKLLHATGVFFSPTRNQVDNPRERRHVADWAQRLEQRS